MVDHMISIIFRTVVVVSLFIIFIVFFGYPAYKRYQAVGVLVEEDEEHVDLITPPAITVCPRNPQSRFKLGWKDSSMQFSVENVLVKAAAMLRNW